MGKGQDTPVNSEELNSKLELIESRLELSMKETITTLISEGLKSIESSIIKFIDKDIDNIKETQKRHGKQHDQHFNNDKDLRQQISDLKDYIHKELTIYDEVKDRKKDSNSNKIVAFTAVGGLILTIISVVATIIIMK